MESRWWNRWKQSPCLLTTRTPTRHWDRGYLRGWEGPPCGLVGREGLGGKEVEVGWDQGLWGVAEADEKSPQSEWAPDDKGLSGGRLRTFRGWEEQKATWPACSLPPWAPRSPLGSQPEPLFSKALSSCLEPKPHPCRPRSFPNSTGPEPSPHPT